MKKSLILGLGMVLMALQANVWAATCATEKKAKGYMVKVLSPAMATVINKNDPFLVQYSDPDQSLGIVVTVALHTITGKKKVAKAVKTLKNQPNSGSVLLTGANLMNPGSKADGKFFFRISGAGKSVDSECFAFAPQLKGAAKQTADAALQGLQQTVKTYAEQIAALTKELAEVKQQLAATGTEGAGSPVKAGSKIKTPSACAMLPNCKAFTDAIRDLQGQIIALDEVDQQLKRANRLIGTATSAQQRRIIANASSITANTEKLNQLHDDYYAEGQQGDLHRHAIQNDHTHEIEASDYISEVSRFAHRHHFVGTTLVPLWDKFETGPAKPEMTITTGTGASCTGSGC